MSLAYKLVLPPTGAADNATVREMFDDVKAYVDTLVISGSAAPIDATYLTLNTNATLTVERVLTAGAGIGFTDNGAGSTLVVANTGVRSLSTSDVNLGFSAATGAITASFSATPTFSSLILQSASGAIGITPSGSVFTSYNLTLPLDTGTSGYVLRTNGATPTAILSWVSLSSLGVSSITGTADQIIASSAIGAVTLSTPQNIGTNSIVNFKQVIVQGNNDASNPDIAIGDSNTGFYEAGTDGNINLILDGTITTIWTASDRMLWNAGPIQSSSFKFRNSAGSFPTVTITPPAGFTSYSLVLPSDDGAPSQYLTTDGSGNLSWTSATGSGTVNSGTANQLAYYASSTTAVSGLTAITASRALVSDTNGLPVASAVTSTTLAFLDATSSVQTQLDAKAVKALSNLASVAINASLLPGTDNSIDLGSASKRWVNLFGKDLDAGASGTAGTVDIYPATSSKGKIQVTAADNSGDTTTTIVNASQAGARTYTIPDAGASAEFVMSKATSTISGTKTFDGQLIAKGTATNDSAAAGYIGEYISGTASGANAGTSTQFFDIASIALTAGDWDIDAQVTYQTNGATTGSGFWQGGIGTVTGNDATGLVTGDNSFQISPPNATVTLVTGSISGVRKSISGSTTYYLKGQATYSVGTPLVYGRISARRRR